METIHTDAYKSMVERLRSAREDAALTQSQLGERLGKDQTFVSKYENRERRLDVVELRGVCDAIGVSIIDIISDNIADNNARETDDDAEQVKSAAVDTFSSYPKLDSEWGHTDWQRLIQLFVDHGILTYKEIGSLMLGHLNPPQVGTSLASKKTFQKHYAMRKTWQAVREWYYKQSGRCADCKTRLELQADHVTPREELGDSADRLDNITLRCRRCNVIRHPSHKLGGQTFVTAEAALMWILFVKRPRTYQSYEALCREYGLSMANIRFQEAWAMARWLAVEDLYEIDLQSTL